MSRFTGIDNLLRPGSDRQELAARGIKFIHGDVRLRSDIEALTFLILALCTVGVI